jgi:hypothetical protein
MVIYSDIYLFVSILIIILLKNIKISTLSKVLCLIPIYIILMEIDDIPRVNKIILLIYYIFVISIANIII